MGGRREGGPPMDTLCIHKHHITHGSCPNGFVENGQSKHPRNSIGSLIPFALGTYPIYLKYNIYIRIGSSSWHHYIHNIFILPHFVWNVDFTINYDELSSSIPLANLEKKGGFRDFSLVAWKFYS
jgi:hypothetical protein